MKAMVLAAGLGTRLRPLTDNRPKALVEVSGRTMLELVLSRLSAFGIRDIIINVHHFADMVVQYLEDNRNFGLRLEISRENILLDTGGGLKKAGWFFHGTSEPFILHNVDVISTIDLPRMVDFHIHNRALATMAVHDRKTSRPLLFDEQLQLCGRATETTTPSGHLHLAFSGIHVVSPRLLTTMNEEGIFSIVTTYLRLAAAGERIFGFRADEYYWRDLGKPESLRQAAEDNRSGKWQ
jgi:NDP-sugar pyrophosphorylase family protein